jgi:hypothetical protein
VVKAGTVMIVFLTDDDTDDGDEESSGSIEHPDNHGIFRTKRALLQKFRE